MSTATADVQSFALFGPGRYHGREPLTAHLGGKSNAPAVMIVEKARHLINGRPEDWAAAFHAPVTTMEGS